MHEKDNLGGRLPRLEPAALEGSSKSLYERIGKTAVPWAEAAGFQIKTADDRLIGPFNVTLFSPELGASFLALQEVEEAHTALSERARQVVILSVGSVWRAPYELYAHSHVARTAGLDETTIRALAAGEVAGGALSVEERVAQRFTLKLVGERRIDDDLYEAAREAFGEKGLVDLIMLVGCYQVVCSLLNGFEIPAPTPAP